MVVNEAEKPQGIVLRLSLFIFVVVVVLGLLQWTAPYSPGFNLLW